MVTQKCAAKYNIYNYRNSPTIPLVLKPGGQKIQQVVGEYTTYKYWALPMGKVREDESPRKAASREDLEETGTKPERDIVSGRHFMNRAPSDRPGIDFIERWIFMGLHPGLPLVGYPIKDKDVLECRLFTIQDVARLRHEELEGACLGRAHKWYIESIMARNIDLPHMTDILELYDPDLLAQCRSKMSKSGTR
jgi:ADP-ribose pyrophosphatase YjhB (NUDIX family)